jgi:hypothetical protein
MKQDIIKQAFGPLSDVLRAVVDHPRPGMSDVANSLASSAGRYRDMIVFDAHDWDDARYHREISHDDSAAYRMYQATKIIPERLTGDRSDPETMASLASTVFTKLLDRLPEFGVDRLVVFLQRTSGVGKPHSWALRFIASDDAFHEADILWNDRCDGVALLGRASPIDHAR